VLNSQTRRLPARADEALDDPQVVHNNIMQIVEGPYGPQRLPRPPAVFKQTPCKTRMSSAPTPGQHNAEICTQFGVTTPDLMAAVVLNDDSDGFAHRTANHTANPLSVEAGPEDAHKKDAVAANPLKHSSGMYMRWDPKATDADSKAAPAAWADCLEKFDASPMMDAAGAPQQMIAMYTFEVTTGMPWEMASDNVVPW
jgi:hypothetical protein